MGDTKVVEAKKQISLEDVKFNEKNKTMAILAWLGLIGTVLYFVEKDDHFVRYIGAQSTIVFLVVMVLSIILGFIPVVGCLTPFLALGSLVVSIMGMVKASKGERFDIPVVSGWALMIMNAI